MANDYFKYRRLPFLAVLLLIIPVSASPAAESPLRGRKILLDPGHATINAEGRVINMGRKTRAGDEEHKLNLEISRKLKEHLALMGATVILTRTPEDYWREGVSTPEDNRDRGYFANDMEADAYLSIHCDWHPRPQYNGVTTYYYKRNSRKLGQSIHSDLIKELKANDRGLVRDSFTVLEAAEMPAVLIEMGYLSNNAEAKKLLSASYQEKIVKAIGRGLIAFFSKP